MGEEICQKFLGGLSNVETYIFRAIYFCRDVSFMHNPLYFFFKIQKYFTHFEPSQLIGETNSGAVEGFLDRGFKSR